jgi:LmbE family N-acetylglucosaminyl deacetylase
MTRIITIKNVAYCILLFFGLLGRQVLANGVQNLQVGHGERLLILAPHPDDESLGAAGLAQAVFANGGSVRSVVVTAGDAYVEAIEEETGRKRLTRADFIRYGEKRLEESRAAAKLLGKGFLHLDLLGFSDGSIYDMLVSNWRKSHPERSEFTGFDHVLYRIAGDKGIAQDGHDLRNELVAILHDTKPTLIAFPDVMENDSDHAGLGMFTLLAISDWLEDEKTPVNPRLLAYLIHWQHGWPPGSDGEKPVDMSNKPMYLPDDLPLRGHQRSCINLTESQVKLKQQALLQYKTQQRFMAPYLAAFVHTNECFTQLKAADTQGVANVIKHWQQGRKNFDSHPLSRKKI